jgi:hypothetical protein
MLAITLGRMCLCCPRHMSTLYETFIDSWCLVLGRVSDNSEKDTAFRGICAVVAQNPAGILHVSARESSRAGFICSHPASPLTLACPILQDMVLFCDAISAYEQPSPELNQDFYNVGPPLMRVGRSSDEHRSPTQLASISFLFLLHIGTAALKAVYRGPMERLLHIHVPPAN